MTAETMEDMLCRKLVGEFKRNGHDLYMVGGSVRDRIIGQPSKDLDFTTKATPEMIKTILRGTEGLDALWDQGEKFGTIGALIRGYAVEITTFRSDKYEQGSRKPEVEFGDNIIDDLARRDFTMNAIAKCLTASFPMTIDPFNGGHDIEHGVIRFVGNPEARIAEDPLRMLRAVRFEAQLGFYIPDRTHEAIEKSAHLIKEISAERVFEELSKMLLTRSPSLAIRRLKRTGLLSYVLPEIHRLGDVEQDSRWHDENVFGHTMDVLDRSFAKLDLRLAALFHDSGKYMTQEIHPADGRITFYGHEKFSGAIANHALRRLKVDNALRGRVVHLCKMHMRPLGISNSKATSKAVRKFIRDAYDNKYGVTVYDVMELNLADVLAHKHPQIEEHNALRHSINEEQQKGPVENLKSPLNGTEVMSLFPGRKQGMWIGYTLRHLTNEVVCGTLDPDDKTRAVEKAAEYVEKEFPE